MKKTEVLGIRSIGRNSDKRRYELGLGFKREHKNTPPKENDKVVSPPLSPQQQQPSLVVSNQPIIYPVGLVQKAIFGYMFWQRKAKSQKSLMKVIRKERMCYKIMKNGK